MDRLTGNKSMNAGQWLLGLFKRSRHGDGVRRGMERRPGTVPRLNVPNAIKPEVITHIKLAFYNAVNVNEIRRAAALCTTAEPDHFTPLLTRLEPYRDRRIYAIPVRTRQSIWGDVIQTFGLKSSDCPMTDRWAKAPYVPDGDPVLLRQAIIKLVETAFSSDYFDICPLNDADDLLDDRNATRYLELSRQLDPYHCVDFHQIPLETRQTIWSIACAYFGLTAADCTYPAQLHKIKPPRSDQPRRADPNRPDTLRR
jgi:hypothetical protein